MSVLVKKTEKNQNLTVNLTSQKLNIKDGLQKEFDELNDKAFLELRKELGDANVSFCSNQLDKACYVPIRATDGLKSCISEIGIKDELIEYMQDYKNLTEWGKINPFSGKKILVKEEKTI